MKNVSKAVLVTSGVVLALVAAAVFGVNLYIQSAAVQLRIQEEIGRALRVPLKITRTSVTPWSSLRITGISIPVGDANLLEATAFRARYRLLPLLAGKLVIRDMVVENPRIVWPQNAEGKWELPKPQHIAAEATGAAPPTDEKSADPAERKPHEERAMKRGLQVVVEGFELVNGSIELRDQAQEKVATFTEVHMHYTTLTPEKIEGTVKIGRILWNQRVAFDAVEASINYSSNALDLPKITGTLGGGPFSASFKVDSAASQSPFTLGMKFDNADLARVATDAGWGEGQASGRLSGSFDLHGSFPRFSQGEGTAQFTLLDGRFHEFSYFEMIGQALQIRQLSDLRLKESTANARIADEKIHFDNLTLNAADLQIAAKGYSRFEDGKLQLTARLVADDALVKQLPGLVSSNFAAGENDTRFIDFNITGKASKPKTDLLDKIVGQKLESQFDDLLNGLFGNRKKKDDAKTRDDAKKKKKKDDETSAEKKKGAAGTADSPVPASTSNQ